VVVALIIRAAPNKFLRSNQEVNEKFRVGTSVNTNTHHTMKQCEWPTEELRDSQFHSDSTQYKRECYVMLFDELHCTRPYGTSQLTKYIRCNVHSEPCNHECSRTLKPHLFTDLMKSSKVSP
jgi:hypothetical protein